MYQILVDDAHCLIDVKLGGFFSLEEAECYVADLRQSHVRHPCLRGGYAMLIDITDCVLQRQDVLGAFAQHIDAFPKADRLAVVTGGSIARMQIRRLLVRDYLRFFDKPAAARAWLRQPAAPLMAAVIA